MDRIKDKVAIVTACTRGIGRAIADRFAEEGAIVYMAVRRVDAGQEIADAHNAQGRRVHVVYFDGDILETIEPMVNKVFEAEGRIDILVNNLGGGVKPGNKDIVGSDIEAIHKAFEFNTIVTSMCAQYAIPYMIQGGGGNIVNISSETAVVPQLTRSWYGIAKTAVNALTEHIAIQYGRQNIRCNAVMPPFTKTDAVKVLPPEFVEQYAKAVPLGRVAEPEDMANAALFLASDEASFITGQCLLVNGGYTLPGADYAANMSVKV